MISRTCLYLLAVIAALGLSACAKVNDMGLRLVSTKVDAYAIVNGQVLTGTVALIPDRTARVNFSDNKSPALACVGGMHYTATGAGVIDLSCSDGAALQMRYSLITETRGYAYGSTPEGPASLVFGMPLEDARAYLTVPAGKRLVERATDGLLELQ
jgi:hypothetical protein